MRVFVSYRRDDSRAYAGRLHDSLAARFGEGRIFQDVSALAPGDDFAEAIDAALDTADVVLVVIGPSWITPGSDGVPRLSDPRDYVRIETARALQRDIKVVPVLVGGASLPHADELPEDLVSLTYRQAVELRDDTWQTDVTRLISSLRGKKVTPRRSVLWVGLGGLGVVAAVASVLLLRGDGEEPTDAPPVSCESPSEPDWTRFLGPEAQLSGTIEGSSGPIEVVVTDAFYQPVDASGRWNVIVATVTTNDATDGVYNEYWNFRQLDVNRFPFEEIRCFSTTRSFLESGERSRAVVGYEVTEDPLGSVRLVVENGGGQVTLDLGP